MRRCLDGLDPRGYADISFRHSNKLVFLRAWCVEIIVLDLGVKLFDCSVGV